jgi:hypothetical protein
MIRFIVAILVVVGTSTAQAQPSRTLPITSAPSGPVPGELSETTALELSLGGTLASYGAVGLAIATAPNQMTGYLGTAGIIGTLIAPTFGHWYAGAIVTRGMGLRAGGLVVAIIGAIADSEGCGLFYGSGPEEEPADCGDNFRTAKGTTLMLTGIAMFVGGTVDDIVTAPGRARRHNERLRAQFSAVAIAPVMHRDGGGFVLTGRF